MRAIVTILAIVVVLVIVGIATNFINLSGTTGSLPTVSVQGGSLPQVKADVGTIDVGTRNASVAVPEVKVDTRRKEVEVPTVNVNRPQ